MEEKIINFDLIKQIMGDDIETLNSFFELFKEQSKIEINDLNKFIDEKNWERVSEIAHKLKSSYGGIGSTSAYDILSEMELKSKNEPDYNLILDLSKKFLDVNNKILEIMENFISN
ncbi:MAG: Hpt domain-containing protein [Ignavibacteria bacterium]|jgi:HPt (histidine-containing phosphotransfer) domain-containing protein